MAQDSGPEDLPRQPGGAPDLSIVVPVFDEEENVVLLHPRIESACAPLGIAFEIVFVDDGSRDRTWERLTQLKPGRGELVLLRLKRNCGQTPAMAAGFAAARGQTVITMDGDLQNDPADIPLLLDLTRSGYDLVCGWRRDRQDRLVTRKLPSRCANWLIRKISGVNVHDYGCSLKAYRRMLVTRMRLYSDMHRFLPFLAQQVGARVTEVPVRHHPRVHGRTKYGLGRIWKVLVDLLSMKVLVHYYRRLVVWFVMMSIPAFLLFVLLGALSFSAPLGSRQVLLGTAAVAAILGCSCVVLGLTSELVVLLHREGLSELLVQEESSGDPPR